MGLGKTYVGSEKAISMSANIILTVCQKSKVQDWFNHFNEHYECRLYDLTNKKDFFNFLNDQVHPDVPSIGIINYDLMFRRPELLELKHFTLMLDESSIIQNDKAKRSKFVMKMKPDNVILLSGTPTAGKYENLWTQIHLLGWKISKELYNKQYVNWEKIEIGDFPLWQVNKEEPYKNVDRLKSKLRQHGAIFMKTEECFDLPEQTFIELKVNSSKEYRKFNRDCFITVEGDELVGDTSLTKRLHLRQLCGQYSKEKIQAFKDLVQSTQDRLIVFYNFNAELLILRNILQELEKPISEINGAVKDLTAYETEDNSVTLVQYQAGAMGLNLQKSNKIVYFTLTDKSELFEQSKKRIHRIGQSKPCFYYLIMCSGSVEENVLEALKMRKDYTDELFREQDNNLWKKNHKRFRCLCKKNTTYYGSVLHCRWTFRKFNHRIYSSQKK